MTAYTKLNVAQLRELCDERGIDWEGLNKRAMIAVLQQYEMHASTITEEQNEEELADDEGSGDEIELGEHLVGDGGGASGAADGADQAFVGEEGESESVTALRLKLALIQAEKEKELAIRNAELEAREREWEIEKERMAMRADTRVSSNDAGVSAPDLREIKSLLPAMSNDDVLSFFMSYERVMILNDVDKSLWAKYLPAQLSSKAMRTYTRLSIEESKDYDKAKDAILASFQLTSQAYYRMFRTMKRTGNNTYYLFLNNMREVFQRYCESSKATDYQSLFDRIVIEHFMLSLPADVQAFVLSHQASCKTVDDYARTADLCYQVKRVSNDGKDSRPSAPAFHRPNAQNMTMARRGGGHTQLSQQGGATGDFTARPSPGANTNWRGGGSFGNYGRGGYQSGFRARPGPSNMQSQRGRGTFWANNSPKTKKPLTARPDFDMRRDDFSVDDEGVMCADQEYVIPLYINGIETHGIRDTGNNGPVLVSKRLIEPDCVNYDKCMTLMGAFDGKNVHNVPTSVVRLRSPRFLYDRDVEVTVGVTDLPAGVECLIGNRLFKEHPRLTDIIAVRHNTDICDGNGEDENDVRQQSVELNDGMGRDCVQIDTTHAATGETLKVDEATAQTDDAVIVISAADRFADCDATATETTDTNGTSEYGVTWTEQTSRPRVKGNGAVRCVTGRDADQPIHELGNDANAVSDLSTNSIAAEMRDDYRTPSDGELTQRDCEHAGLHFSDPPDPVMTTRSAAAAARAKQSNERSDRCEQTPDRSSEKAQRDSSGESDELRRVCAELGNIDINDMGDGANSEDARQSQFAQAQLNDETLKHLWLRAKAGSSELCIINGLLYKRVPASVSNSMYEYALVLPSDYQRETISLAHDKLLSGHGGVKRTEDRIKALFFFPQMRKKVKAYIKTCHKCQMVAPIKARERQPMQPMDVTAGRAFEDWSLDIMGGQLPVTQRKNKYAMVLLCNVTKYVHAIPLPNLRAGTIADKLIEFFSYVGLPKVIRSDNFQSFHAELMVAMRQKLGIDSRFSAPFHFMSHGSVERVQGTIEHMLRKFIVENPSHWDTLLPYFLFALREVPNASTGASSFELVYGHKMMGLLHVARETWTKTDPLPEYKKIGTTQYIEQLRERIDKALAAARVNSAAAQQRMKANYDKKSSIRELQPDDFALLLLPTSGNKLLSTWSGPYRVIRKCANGNYELLVGNRKAIYHINSLRKYNSEINGDTAQCMMIVTDDSDETAAGEDGLPPVVPDWTDGGATNEFTIGQQLTDDQRAAMQQLLESYPDVFTTEPGWTGMIEHDIRLTDERPCYQPPYKIPEALRDDVEAELMTLLDNGIIQYEDYTNWNSPLIIVRKRGGGIRLVNNFISLNKKTVDEQYPMNDPNELLSRVAGGKYLTRVDLRKAFSRSTSQNVLKSILLSILPLGCFHIEEWRWV